MRLILNILLFSYLIQNSFENSVNRTSKGAYAYSTNIEIRCFSGDSFVKLSNGYLKNLSSLKSGENLLTIDSNNNLISTEFVLMLHQQYSNQSLFYTLKTLSGHWISLSEYHLIPIKSSKNSFSYLFAKQIRLGDYLYVLNNLRNQIEFSPVIQIKVQLKKGYYAPLTKEGTLLVNNILASCFAHTKSHYFSQISMYPIHIYYQLIQFFHLNIHQTDGLHWIVNILFNIGQIFLPHFLVLS